MYAFRALGEGHRCEVGVDGEQVYVGCGRGGRRLGARLTREKV